MAVLHSYECPKGHLTEKLVDPKVEGWKIQLCSSNCKEQAEQVFLPRGVKFQDALHIVVYRDASGHTIYPGKNGKMPERYSKEGYERVEMNFHEARRFTQQMNRDERAKMARHMEKEQIVYEQVQAQQRDDLRQAMRHMSPLGRDYARAAMELSNNQEHGKYLSVDPGFHNEALDG
jgi:hypothetical protein